VIKDDLAAGELPVNLDSLFALSIRIDGWLRECRSERRSDLGHTHPSAVARSSSKEYGSPRRLFFRRGSEDTRASSRMIDDR
jgi:hypothetical protein